MQERLNVPSKQEAVKHVYASARSWCRRRVHSCCEVKTLKRKIPIAHWLPNYEVSHLISDVIAGLSVGLTLIPQSIAYATVAHLPVQYGLYSSIMGCFVYCIFGSTREVNIGPTAIMGLLTAEYVKRGGPAAAVLLCFLAGCIEFLFGIFNLGFLIDFISSPVISGFSSAAALIIAATQLKSFCGIKIEDDGFIWVVYNVFKHIPECNYWDLILGIVSLTELLLLRKLANSKMQEKESQSKVRLVFKKFLWFISTARNAIVVILASVLTYLLCLYNLPVLTMTGNIESGLPSLEPPVFEVFNSTEGVFNNVKEYGSGLALIPLLAILEHIAIAKIFCRGKSLDASQELIALGLSNIAGSFISSFPVTGSFSRSALNASCGVKTPLNGIFTGILVLLAVSFLASSFHYIPKASLAAVIIAAVIFMIDFKLVPHLWKTKKIDLAVMLVTFFSCIFFGPEYGILIGIAFAILVLLKNTARPRISIQKMNSDGLEYILIQPDRMLNFPSVEYLRKKIMKETKGFEATPVIFDGIYICGVDYTVAQCVKDLATEFNTKHQILLFINLKANVLRTIRTLKPTSLLHYETLSQAETALRDKSVGDKLTEEKLEAEPNGDLTNVVVDNQNIQMQNGDCSLNATDSTTTKSPDVITTAKNSTKSPEATDTEGKDETQNEIESDNESRL